MSKLINRRTSISQNIIGIAQYLRGKGFRLTVNEEADALKALQINAFNSQDEYINILRACFAKNNYQFRKFEEFYKDYLFELKKAVDSKEKKVPEKKSVKSSRNAPSLDDLKNWLYNSPKENEEAKSSYSAVEVLARKDFSQMTSDEIELISKLLESLAKRILRKKSRLKKISKRNKNLDLRLTIKKNLKKGSELNEIVYAENKIKKLRITLLCDVSKSMDLYSRFFIQFIYAFHQSSDNIRTFVFSTALHDVSEIFQNFSYTDALDEISERIPQWSGGTRIGDCMHTFVEEYGHSTLDKKTILIILSDGWDTGAPETLAQAMSMMRSKCRKIFWLNPLAGHPEFKPESIGLQTVLPYIHQMYAAHNLQSLSKVIRNI